VLPERGEMSLTEPWLGLALVMATFGMLLAVFSLIGHLLQPEVLRKGLHISLGLTALSFPWLFEDVWPVMLLGAASIVGFLGVRIGLPLLRRLAHSLAGITRVSIGEFCFIAATCIVFAVASDDPVLYSIPMLVLTLADAAAALVGTAYGRRRYHTWDDYKTLEGSAAFFAVAFVCIFIPLAFFTDASNAQSAAVAALVAMATTVLEASMSRGFDNLLVPLGALAAIEATGLTQDRPAALESGSPIVVAALSLVIALLVLLLAGLASWLRASPARRAAAASAPPRSGSS
jgi:phytol kinase